MADPEPKTHGNLSDENYHDVRRGTAEAEVVKLARKANLETDRLGRPTRKTLTMLERACEELRQHRSGGQMY